MSRRAAYPGSFDPLTIAHLGIAEAARDRHALDRVDLVISEVAPWGSGNNTPYGVDWFEVTNTGASAVTLTGWKMDDNSNAFANAVLLNGVTTIAPGESVIFMETANLAAASGSILSFQLTEEQVPGEPP